ncbi:hypothetical protein ACFWTE_07655 [Nocardiopsis sp. NPDC058631]|uniref:hypothetical protein n=1 Tax=Nocardiopsis sp. NPDC058631 TaxID=3346566 RepID=UPI003669F0EC
MTDIAGPAHAPGTPDPAPGGAPEGPAASGGRTRWPAYALAVVFLGYAAGKAVYAAQGRLGFPSGPAVSAGEHERYAEQMMDVALTQWLAVATGVLCAALVVATVTSAGRRVPRVLMLPALAVMLVGIGAGAVTLVVDGFVGIGVGWQWYHGVVGAVVLGLMAATTGSYLRESRRGAV